MKYSTRKRRQSLEWHNLNGCNVAATSRQFGVSRSTVYRWLGRYDPANPARSLRAHSRRPHNRRKPLWSEHHLARGAYVCCGWPIYQRKTPSGAAYDCIEPSLHRGGRSQCPRWAECFAGSTLDARYATEVTATKTCFTLVGGMSIKWASRTL